MADSKIKKTLKMYKSSFTSSSTGKKVKVKSSYNPKSKAVKHPGGNMGGFGGRDYS